MTLCSYHVVLLTIVSLEKCANNEMSNTMTSHIHLIKEYRVCHFIICSLIPNLAAFGLAVLGKKYGAFLNSFQPKMKRLSRRLEWIKVRLDRHKGSVLFNNSHTHKLYIYIYI